MRIGFAIFSEGSIVSVAGAGSAKSLYGLSRQPHDEHTPAGQIVLHGYPAVVGGNDLIGDA